MRAFRAALTFLTRLPVGRLEAGDFARAPGWFAAAGLVIGAAGAGVWWLAAAIWPPVLAALAAVAAMLLITGALHEDGLADAFDGLGSGRPAERASGPARPRVRIAAPTSPSARCARANIVNAAAASP